MNCFVHDRTAAIGICAVCQRAVCRECVGRDAPRLVCRVCLDQRAIQGFEYRSAASIGSWPLIHICIGVDLVTMRPKISRGIIAIGNIAIGGVAIAGVALGIISFGGLSVGLALALGGVAVGLGLSVGGVAVGLGLSVGGVAIGSVALGGLAIGFQYAIGGGAFGPVVIDGRGCDPAAADFVRQWLGERILPRHCR
jgi:hypothetical protein